MSNNHKIYLKNDKSFIYKGEDSIFHAAEASGINLEHSCLSSRCRSCMVKVISGYTLNNEEEYVLTDEEKNENFVLSCNAKPISDLELDIEDLADITIYEKKIIPAKIDHIEELTEDIFKVILRLPPNSNFNFNSGQYVNITAGALTRSYSIGNSAEQKVKLEFFIKIYKNGLMSQYWSREAKINDLIRIEGPIGTFFYRNSMLNNIIFLATGTGIAPINSILQELDSSSVEYQNKTFWVILGARYEKDLFWEPKLKKVKVNYIPVLSRSNNDWMGERGYVQDVVLKKQIDLRNAQVYACGSNDMIISAKELLLKNNLDADKFFSDAFIQTN